MFRAPFLALLAAVAAAVAGCSSPSADLPAPVVAAVEAPAAAEPALPPVPVVEPVVSARAYAAIVVDADTGKVLHETDATSLRYPASLTKMMTLYLLFDEIEAGRLSRATPLAVSAKAASQPPTKLGARAGSTLTADEAARALAVHSANDAAVVIAENIAGSEEAFAQRMTAKARVLGMRDTQFINASGLPDGRQVSTARDMAILGRALHANHPRYFGYFGLRESRFGSRRWTNTNKLLESVDGMNGIKTGYIRASGYNLVASVERDGRHIIAVVIGGRSGTDRNARMTALIEEHMPQQEGWDLLGF